MKVKYVGWHSNDCFKIGKEYETIITVDGLQVIDDTGAEHIIGDKNNEYSSFQEDEFFRNNFEFV